MDAREVAKGLCYKQAAALRGVFAWSSPVEQERGEQSLRALGLWKPKVPGGILGTRLTPLGEAVLAHLLEGK